MRKLFLLTGVLLFLLPLSFAHTDQLLLAPSDVVLQLETERNSRQFHLGELIPVKFSYTANAPGRYLWVSQSSKLDGGGPLEFSCSPSAERVRRHSGSPDGLAFDPMLNAPCAGVGVGGGAGSEIAIGNGR
jgi:hypothetical protein